MEASCTANMSRWRKSGVVRTISSSRGKRSPSRMFQVHTLNGLTIVARMDSSAPFGRLDYLYTPSDEVARDAKFFTDVLVGKLGLAVEGMGARVAMIELTEGPPHVLLTDHLDGDRPIFIYRVEDLKRATSALKKRGLKGERQLEIPMGPCSSFV